MIATDTDGLITITRPLYTSEHFYKEISSSPFYGSVTDPGCPNSIPAVQLSA
jgi:hypothetical protein